MGTPKAVRVDARQQGAHRTDVAKSPSVTWGCPQRRPKYAAMNLVDRRSPIRPTITVVRTSGPFVNFSSPWAVVVGPRVMASE